MFNSLWPHELYSPWNSPGQSTGVGSHSLFQVIFPTQGLNPGLPRCRQILYQLSQEGSPRILEWGSLSLPQGNFPTQESNWGLILSQLSYQGSPPGSIIVSKFIKLYILVAYSFFVHQKILVKFKKLYTHLSYEPAILLLDIYLEEIKIYVHTNLYTNIH